MAPFGTLTRSGQGGGECLGSQPLWCFTVLNLTVCIWGVGREEKRSQPETSAEMGNTDGFSSPPDLQILGLDFFLR